MGRQIAVRLSREKEREFLQFLKSRNCVIILPWSETKKINILSDFPNNGPYLRIFYIWNKDFDIDSNFIKIRRKYKTTKYSYGFSTIAQPLIEYSRKPIYRIYWEKYFSMNNPKYDVLKFEKWYNEVTNWIKKNCKYIEGVYVG